MVYWIIYHCMTLILSYAHFCPIKYYLAVSWIYLLGICMYCIIIIIISHLLFRNFPFQYQRIKYVMFYGGWDWINLIWGLWHLVYANIFYVWIIFCILMLCCPFSLIFLCLWVSHFSSIHFGYVYFPHSITLCITFWKIITVFLNL